MLPEEFVHRLDSQDYIDPDSLIEALQQPASYSVRINSGKWFGDGPAYERVPWEPSGCYLTVRPSYTYDPLFHAGVYYPQEASGMFTGEMFRQLTAGLTDIRVLDLCGAPGGKSTQLSSVIGDNGFLVSNEVIRQRAAVLSENITKWGMGNAIVTNNDPSAFASLEGFFDVIVVDAPCSGEGMFHDVVARNEWSVENTRLCSDRQKRILMDVWPALKPGGLLIYSTCTFNPDENERNISWLSANTGAESLRIDISAFNGITEITYQDIAGYGFYPGRIKGDGFFISAVRKPATGTQKRHNTRTKPGKRIPLAESYISEKSFLDPARAVMFDKKVIVLGASPDIFGLLQSRLNIIKSGTMIGDLIRDSIIPAHDLAMSVKIKKEGWQRFDADYHQAMAYLRFETLKPEELPMGRVLISYRNISLGFLNNLGNRINNGYPQGWRIRTDKKEEFSSVI